tara:strand:+ start:126 stop:512 length:387 start_codon:yes stop_codon:yes gene_type:complete
MIFTAPVSLGELLDKISILLIKKKKIKNKNKLKLINNELKKLQSILVKSNIKKDKLKKYLNLLKNINLKLWMVEDKLRECEKSNNFNNNFIKLARSVYKFNDKRANIKLNINKKFKSTIIEVKSYEKY